MKKYLWYALTCVFALSCRVGAQPDVREFAPPVAGRVVVEKTGAGARATIKVYWRNNVVATTQTDGAGEFRLETLPLPERGKPDYGFEVLATPSANDADLAPRAAHFGTPQIGGAPWQLKLRPAQPTRIFVNSTQGEPLAGATVSIERVLFAAINDKKSPSLAWSSKPLLTPASGTVVFAGLPTGAYAELRVSKKNYADTIAVVPGFGAHTVRLAREAVVAGRVTLDGEPLGVTQWRLKMQGWQAPWRSVWRVAYLDRYGYYAVRNLTSIEVLGEPSYSINFDFDANFDPTSGLHGTYVPPGRGWDAMVTRTRDGKTERFISYVHALGTGLVYAEGDDVAFDVNLEPMALIKGRLPAGERGEVSYRPARSVYGAWAVTPDEEGNFEIPVPTRDGAIALRVGNRTVSVADLKPQETRVIDVAAPAMTTQTKP